MRIRAVICIVWLLAAPALAGCARGGPGTAPASQSPVAAMTASGVRTGNGFYGTETQNGTSFKWVNNDARIILCSTADHDTLHMTIEPGPSLGAPMVLEARTGSGVLSIRVPDRRSVSIPVSHAKTQVAVLHVHSRNLPIPQDARHLNFRVFSMTLDHPGRCTDQVIDDPGELKAANNWYALEHGVDAFRWVNNDAQLIALHAVKAGSKLSLDVEPGPALGGAPLVLSLSAGKNQTIGSSSPLEHRDVVEFRLPALNAGTVLTIHAKAPTVESKTPNDPRTLNFRVFDVHLEAGNQY